MVKNSVLITFVTLYTLPLMFKRFVPLIVLCVSFRKPSLWFKKSTQKTCNLSQIIRRVIEIENNLICVSSLADGNLLENNAIVFKEKHSRGPLSSAVCAEKQFKRLEFKSFTFRIDGNADNCAILCDCSVIQICNFVTNADGNFIIVRKYLEKS